MIAGKVILSFDVEEHFRIEAARNVATTDKQQSIYSLRMEESTDKILEMLADFGARATFFIVGRIGTSRPQLVRRIASAGHEIASHSWDHRRVHEFSERHFAEDVRISKDILEQASGQAVYGFRAPTFSVMRETAWAIDQLVEQGFFYDSSIFPVHHDRYGVAQAPRVPFLARGQRLAILELPPLTWQILNYNVPVAGGGYFRLFPPAFMNAGIQQALKQHTALAMLYFHPWEFDAQQPRLPLRTLASWRTYVGIHKTSKRLRQILSRYQFIRAIDQARSLDQTRLIDFQLATPCTASTLPPLSL